MAALRQLCSAEISVLSCVLVATALRGSEKSDCNSLNVDKSKTVGDNVRAVTEWLHESKAGEKKAVVIG